MPELNHILRDFSGVASHLWLKFFHAAPLEVLKICLLAASKAVFLKLLYIYYGLTWFVSVLFNL